MFTIYRLVHRASQKCYVGQTKKTAEERWSQHVCSAAKNAQNCRYLEFAIRKYGPEAFDLEVLETVDQGAADESEIWWIAHFGSDDNALGYNLTSGGQSGWRTNVSVREDRAKVPRRRRSMDPAWVLSGMTFGLFRVTDQWKVDKQKRWWLCQCECGIDKWVQAARLLTGETKSCGCASGKNREIISRDEMRRRMLDWQRDNGRALTVKEYASIPDRLGGPELSSFKRQFGAYFGDVLAGKDNRHDLTGQRFGRLIVVGEAAARVSGKYKTRMWSCACDCGATTEVRHCSLVAETSRSCGCLRHDRDAWNMRAA